MYTSFVDKIIEVRDKTLKKLANKLGNFYLAGGTALSLFYFKHRESYDLDFFTKDFSRANIEEIISALSKDMGLEVELLAEQNRQGFARMMVYSLKVGDDSSLKIDFVEDVYKLLKPLKNIDGAPILAIEDIYFRKILTACGSIATVDSVGRSSFAGGRQEAKDFFDLYFLSKTFMPLSNFVNEFCQQPQKESIIVWFRTYDRFAMKTGLLEIITDKKVEFSEMERHFKNEVEKIVAGEI
ncbi:MAG: nucleotidyl transferase AbiEii/AbiGii toxin family protein [Candidatus Omnitrophota bacterium]|nr:nucleotidyl transferase AbiEii/AbiGii toxin family protein [Candidatus Omnitrophota bacterium]